MSRVQLMLTTLISLYHMKHTTLWTFIYLEYDEDHCPGGSVESLVLRLGMTALDLRTYTGFHLNNDIDQTGHQVTMLILHFSTTKLVHETSLSNHLIHGL